MLKLLLKSISLLVVAGLTCGYIIYLNPLVPKDPNGYMATIIDKHRRLDSLPSPKLIFVGASNLAFGLNCKLIEDSLKIPTVNMGLHGALGLPFILNEVKSNIKAGDIVILSLEYYLLFKSDIKLIKRTIDLYPEAANYVEMAPIKKAIQEAFYVPVLAANLKRIQTTILHGLPPKDDPSKKIPMSGYRRNMFSEYGDVVGELNYKLPAELRDSKMNIDDYSEGIKTLDKFADYVRSKDASIYFCYSNYPEKAFEKNKKPIYNFKEQLDKQLNIEIINTPEDFVFPEKDFLDTVNHLNKQGREKRTMKMIQILKARVFKNR
jgi:hypothetical protein